jgi:membrane protease YdiL (CAAX protease family)
LSARNAFLVGVSVLVVYNVARAFGLFGNLVGLSAIALACVFLVIARSAGLDAAALGTAPADVQRGFRYGAAAFALIAIVLATVAAIPATSTVLSDSRGDISGAELVFRILISTLIVTVIPEELAFRGVLLGAGMKLWQERKAVLVTSALFGLWHISPTLNHDLSQAHATATHTLGAVAGTVAVTFFAGIAFCWLRLRSHSLLAPVLAHLGTNGVALAAAWVLARH